LKREAKFSVRTKMDEFEKLRMMYGKERANNESKRQTLNEFLHSLKGEFISLLSWNENFDATLNQEMKSLEPKI
jgi:hypothetical protein